MISKIYLFVLILLSTIIYGCAAPTEIIKTEIVKIESIVEHSPEIKSFVIRSSRIAQAYRPGEFVILWLPDVDFLPMSISNVFGNLIEITVQKIGEGTAKLFELKEGDNIERFLKI